MRLYSILALLFVFLLSGCSWVQFPSIHKTTIQQGNIVSQEMVTQLKIGMTKTQVQYILGTPLIVDTFNPSRWDYYYTRVDSNSQRTEKQLSLTFDKNNALLSIDGDYLMSRKSPEDGQ
ncbi:MAG: outer membrane protein assembly factor BamE [Porticoccaceae bacterium]|nr:outer membrane protein assembly factor BamE [Porticoccaceae bacterium]